MAKLSKIDRDGFKVGRVKKGMSKEGVVYAIGCPARHMTPSLDADSWKYWKGRYDTMLVKFDDNKVSGIID